MSGSTLLAPAADTSPAHTPDDGPLYRRLSYDQIRKVLVFTDEGLTQAQIAHHLGVDQSTICKALQRLGPDTSDLAIRRAKAASLTAMDRAVALVKTAKPETQLKAARTVMEVSGVLSTDTGVGTKVQVAIVLGVQVGAPASACSVPTTIHGG